MGRKKCVKAKGNRIDLISEFVKSFSSSHSFSNAGNFVDVLVDSWIFGWFSAGNKVEVNKCKSFPVLLEGRLSTLLLCSFSVMKENVQTQKLLTINAPLWGVLIGWLESRAQSLEKILNWSVSSQGNNISKQFTTWR